MIKQFLTILFLVLSSACSGLKDSHIIFSGNVKNSLDEVITVSNYNSTMREDFPIDSAGNFKANVKVNKDGYYFFKVGRPYSTVRFKKDKNVHVDIDADNFFKSRRYSGELSSENNFSGFWIKRQNYFMGKKIRFSGWRGDKVIRLFKRDKCMYEEKHVHAEIICDGNVGLLKSRISHYTFKDISHYLEKWDRYSTWSAKDHFDKGQKPTLFHFLKFHR